MRFYFTFGSDEGFPYQNTYIVIDAPNRAKAHKTFREKFPDRTENIYNFSYCYEEKIGKNTFLLIIHTSQPKQSL